MPRVLSISRGAPADFVGTSPDRRLGRSSRRDGTSGLALLLTVCLAAACSNKGEPAADAAAWKKQILEGRARNEAEWKTSPASPLSAIERRALRGPEPVHVEVQEGAASFSGTAGENTALSFRADGRGRWSWEEKRSGITATARSGGRSLAPGPIAESSLFRLDARFSLLAQPASGELVLMLHDADRDELRQFRGLEYFEPDRRFAVAARVERAAAAENVTIPTTLKLEKSYARYARLHFIVNGQPGELTAYRPAGAPPGALFVPFRDATSGRATYGGGRYLDLQEPTGDSIEIDFNRAYNPMCVYSSAYNCPIPPPENKLAIAIEAGEKTYGH